MRLGLIARADRTGLAIQTENLHRHLKPAAVLVVDFQRFGFHPDLALYSTPATHVPTWLRLWSAPNYARPTFAACDYTTLVDEFLSQVDVVISCETFYDARLLHEAKRRGVRTILQPNYEFMDYLIDRRLEQPDLFALPTAWHQVEIESALPDANVIVLPVPVDSRFIATRRKVTRLRSIVHIAGNVAQTDRAGTRAFVEAMRHVHSDVTATIRAQRPLPNLGPIPNNVVVIDNSPTRSNIELFEGHDALVLPRRYGGLCLPMQEALGLGLPVAMSDCTPQRDMLPSEMLLPCGSQSYLQTRVALALHDVPPTLIAEWIDRHAATDAAIAWLSDAAWEWADTHSWPALMPRWETAING